MDNELMTGDANWKERQRLAEIFGEDLPLLTVDQSALCDGDGDHPADASDSDEWLITNKPPHHE